MDVRDARILKLLQRDARISNAELAEACGMSASACWRRVKALEELGVIERYSAVLDPGSIGLSFHAITHVQLSRHNKDWQTAFVDGVTQRSEVQECYATTGQSDYHLRVLCAGLEAYNRFLEDFLFRLPGIQSVQTHVVLRDIKRSSVLEPG